MKKPFIIGLTGSIGMGKTTTARMFADEGLPVWNADEAVHRLYEKGGAAVAEIAAIHPDAVNRDGVDRTALKHWIATDPAALGRLESIVHPLLEKDRAEFLENTEAAIVVFDVPLLFETGLAISVDAVVVVTAPPDEQEARVLARSSMDRQTFETLRAKQMPDDEKRVRADCVVETHTLEGARAQVQTIVQDIQKRQSDA